MSVNENIISDYALSPLLLKGCRLTTEQIQHALGLTAKDASYEGMK